MAKDSQRLEQEFIAAAKEKTGRAVPEWMGVIGTTGLDKPNAILKWLKAEHGLNHMQANFLSGIYLNDGKPVFDYAVMFARLFEGKDDQLAIYKVLEGAISAELPEVVFIPTKSYMSIEGERVFGCATPARTLVRVGLDLGDLPVDDYVQKARGLGAMPNIGHMVEVESPDGVDGKLVGLVRQSYERVHNK
jgi:hypothetical protein